MADQPPEVLALAATLRERRLDLGLSQTEVAKAAGLTRTYVNQIEAGARDPKYSALRKLATGYRTELAEIIAAAERAAADADQT